MNPGDLVHVKLGPDRHGFEPLAEDGDGEAAVFVVESANGQSAVIRWADDEVELIIPVADLIPVNPLS